MRDNVKLERIKDAINDALDEFDRSILSEAQLRENAKFVLESMADAGIRLALVTSSGHKTIPKPLEKFGIRHCFEVIVTRNDGERMKPSPEGIEKALVALAYDKRDALYIGDSWVDIRPAKDAGLIAVAITGGIGATERLKKESPDHLINSLDDLPKLIGIKKFGNVKSSVASRISCGCQKSVARERCHHEE